MIASKECFWWGILGAVLPQITKFFALVSNGQPSPHIDWLAYSILAVIYTACAGFVAIAWKPDAVWKALWVGASLPALVGTLVQAAPTVSTH